MPGQQAAVSVSVTQAALTDGPGTNTFWFEIILFYSFLFDNGNNKLLLLKEIVVGVLRAVFLQMSWKTRACSSSRRVCGPRTHLCPNTPDSPVQRWRELPPCASDTDAPWKQTVVARPCFPIPDPLFTTVGNMDCRMRTCAKTTKLPR